LTRDLHALQRRAGLLENTLRHLRHTPATIALMAGVHPKLVSERHGHASTQITLDRYSHALDLMLEAAAEAIGRFLQSDWVAHARSRCSNGNWFSACTKPGLLVRRLSALSGEARVLRPIRLRAGSRILASRTRRAQMRPHSALPGGQNQLAACWVVPDWVSSRSAATSCRRSIRTSRAHRESGSSMNQSAVKLRSRI
jgi:hypothetical protein